MRLRFSISLFLASLEELSCGFLKSHLLPKYGYSPATLLPPGPDGPCHRWDARYWSNNGDSSRGSWGRHPPRSSKSTFKLPFRKTAAKHEPSETHPTSPPNPLSKHLVERPQSTPQISPHPKKYPIWSLPSSKTATESTSYLIAVVSSGATTPTNSPTTTGTPS